MQGLRGSQLIWDCSLLYPLRHPDFLRKSCSGGLPYGALGRGGISIREKGRAVVVVLAAEPGATTSQVTSSPCMGTLRWTHKEPVAAGRLGGTAARSVSFGQFPALRTIGPIVANSSPDSVLEAFRRKSGGRSPAPLASPPGATPEARSCGSSRTEQGCYRNDARNNSRVKLTCLATV